MRHSWFATLCSLLIVTMTGCAADHSFGPVRAGTNLVIGVDLPFLGTAL
jgi:hypothetical protein